MPHLNIEIKAECSDHERIRNILVSRNADFKGVDHQIDTYFKVQHGRLKLREGNIENALIYYKREEKKGPKEAKVTLFPVTSDSPLKEVLKKSLDVLIIVDKLRGIYFIDNVKFHLDEVLNLGKFIEIEAIDLDGNIGKEKLLEQCNDYLDLFKIPKDNLISGSYSDLLLKRISPD